MMASVWSSRRQVGNGGQDYRILAANRAFLAVLGEGGETLSQSLSLDEIGDALAAVFATGEARCVPCRDDARKLSLDISIARLNTGLALIPRYVTERSL